MGAVRGVTETSVHATSRRFLHQHGVLQKGVRALSHARFPHATIQVGRSRWANTTFLTLRTLFQNATAEPCHGKKLREAVRMKAFEASRSRKLLNITRSDVFSRLYQARSAFLLPLCGTEKDAQMLDS